MNYTTLLNHYYSEKARQDMQSMDINSAVVQSLHFVIGAFFLKAASTFVITISCNSASTLRYYQFILEHLFRNSGNMVVQLVVMQNGQAAYVAGQRQHNLYLVDSLHAFLNADPIQYAADYNTNEYYYIFLQQRDELLPQEVQGVLDYCWRHHIINCNVQIQKRSGQILVYTYYPYRTTHCGLVRPTLVNEFVAGRMVNSTIFPKKLLNFHECSLRVATWHIPPFLKLQNNNANADTSASNLAIGGFEGLLLLELAKHLNFYIEAINLGDANQTQNNKSSIIGDYIQAALQKLQNRAVDITLGYLRENSERDRLVTSLASHYQVTQVLSVLGTADTYKYTSFEILGFPFKSSTWCIILLTLLTGLTGVGVIAITRQHSSDIMLYFFAVSIGLCSSQIPERQRERLLYINWALSTFILRSIYAALLYELFCRNLYRQPPNTIDALLEQNYTIVLNEDVHIGISDIAQFNDQHRLPLELIDSIEEVASFIYLEQNDQRKLAAMGAMEMLLYYGRHNNKPNLFYILPEVVMQQPLTIYLTKHSFLADQFNELLQNIHAAGLMEYWLQTELDLSYFRSMPAEDQKYIGQSELNGIYFICMSLMCLATFVFLLEVCLGRV